MKYTAYNETTTKEYVVEIPTYQTDSWIVVGLVTVGLYVTTRTGVKLAKRVYHRLHQK